MTGAFDPAAIFATLIEHDLGALLEALRVLDAEYATLHNPPIRPDLAKLRSLRGPQLFRTRHGRLDVLKEAGGDTYETLRVDAHPGPAGTFVASLAYTLKAPPGSRCTCTLSCGQSKSAAARSRTISAADAHPIAAASVADVLS